MTKLASQLIREELSEYIKGMAGEVSDVEVMGGWGVRFSPTGFDNNLVGWEIYHTNNRAKRVYDTYLEEAERHKLLKHIPN